MAQDTPNEEHALVAKAEAGSAEAFEQLYRAHVGRVYGLCLRMTGNVSDAEECTQNAFVRAWERLSSFRGDSSFSTWLCRVAVNIVLGEFRQDGRRRARNKAFDEAHNLTQQTDHDGLGVRMDLEEAIAALPEGARTAFVLHDVEGYRHHEIAAMTEIAAGTSKAQLHRARRLLREALGR